jgi:L-seryl-tRNA(Ser) seleniumtransferase
MSGNSEGNLYQLLPPLHELLQTTDFVALLEIHSRDSVVDAARAVLARLKTEIGDGRHTEMSLEGEVVQMHVTVANEVAESARFRLRRVINATGVVLHTNLGRSPLSASALAHIFDTASGYSNLELDLESGERSRRDVHVEKLILRVAARPSDAVSTLSALVVNNCAAATFLALNTLAEGGEVIVSRGELVEIGGGFRIPEILGKSGARLREVGTTNRTRLGDYESAISDATRLILRVHQSNFSMAGFVQRPALRDLVSLGKRAGVPVFDDQGTGLMGSLAPLGIHSEPTLPESLRVGTDVVAASGDKLLGGPQCGLLVGRRELLQNIRKNPLFRTYRVDKLIYAALEATLMDYALQRESAIPLQRMLRTGADTIFSRCEWISGQVRRAELTAEAVPAESLIGGGTAPTARLRSAAVSLCHATLQPQELLLALRRLDPPVIGRIHKDHVLLDLRTVEPEFDSTLVLLLQQIASGSSTTESVPIS